MAVTRFLRMASDYLAHRKGLPLLVGVGLILLNFLVTFLPQWPAIVWLSGNDLLLHLGAIVGLLGVLIGDAL
jgi:hypothetical protein